MTDGGEGTYGRFLSEETKNKISQSHMGKKLSPDHIKKISDGNKGKPKPDGFAILFDVYRTLF
jgi:hypothetical protein